MIYIFSYSSENMENTEVDCDSYSFDECPENDDSGCMKVTFQSKGNRQVCAQFDPLVDCGAYRNGSCPLPMCMDDDSDDDGSCIASE